MQIQLTPDQETRLALLAARDGRSTDDLVRDAVERLLDEGVRFAEAVRFGLAAADRGDFVSPAEVCASVERALKP